MHGVICAVLIAARKITTTIAVRNTPNATVCMVNVPVKHKLTFYVNVYEGDTLGRNHATRESADRGNQEQQEITGMTRIACIPVTVEYEEGEGLQ